MLFLYQIFHHQIRVGSKESWETIFSIFYYFSSFKSLNGTFLSLIMFIWKAWRLKIRGNFMFNCLSLKKSIAFMWYQSVGLGDHVCPFKIANFSFMYETVEITFKKKIISFGYSVRIGMTSTQCFLSYCLIVSCYRKEWRKDRTTQKEKRKIKFEIAHLDLYHKSWCPAHYWGLAYFMNKIDGSLLEEYEKLASKISID